MARTGKHPPIFNVPPVVTAILAVTVAIHLFRMVLSDATDWSVFGQFALVPRRDLQDFPDALLPLVGHAFLHADWTHLLINCGFLLAFGGAIGRLMPAPRLLLF